MSRRQESHPSPPPAGPSFNVFAVNAEPAAGESTGQGTLTTIPSRTKSYKPRKFHTKSTLGCMTCKARRIRCDLEKPVCNRCQKRQISCLYLPAHGRAVAQRYVNSLQQMANPPASMWPGAHSPDVVASAAREGRLDPSSFDLRLLEHFGRCTAADIANPQVAEVFNGPIVSLALERPYLMHAVLAVAASHLRRLETAQPSHRIAEVSHWQQALAAFQTEISAPLRQDNADAVILTSMMLNLMSFSFVEGTSPRDSWVFSTASDRLDWLALQLGLIPLLVDSRPFREGSVLLPMYAASDDEKGTYSQALAEQATGIDGILPDFVALCGLDAMLAPERSPYYMPLRVLSPMMALPRTVDNQFIFTTFVGTVREGFMSLLRRNEERALLIFAYWLGLMCGINRWWAIDRVKRDCTAICMWLEERGSEAVRALLHVPARNCGYDLGGQTRITLVED